MNEGAAPDDDSSEEAQAQSSGEVVPFNRPASIEYDGEAQRTMAQLSELALKISALNRKAKSRKLKRETEKLLDRIAARMELIGEHIDVLEVHADMILECMSEEENIYFVNDSKIAPNTITSLIKKRCRTLRVQKVVVGKTGHAYFVSQDNDKQRLTDCDGSLACQLDDKKFDRRA